MSQKVCKAKYWTAVLYPECMFQDWQNNIEELLQIPYEYCIHNSDLTIVNENRKVHVHVVIAFPNTTTYKHALSVFQRLQPNIQYCEQVLNIRYIHEYLIHNTDKCKREKKHLYAASDRVSGNGFDIGAYEQISLSDKRKMCKDLCDYVVNERICNFTDFYSMAFNKFGDDYFEVLCTYSGLIERLCKGNYLIMQKSLIGKR